ncbi:MAG TPA: hypothetical protein VIQ11_09450 [Mycobacterium sp.]
MQITVRSYLTAGVALAGASVIAVSPVVVTKSDTTMVALPTSSVAVELTAAVNPITAWADVFASAAENAVSIGNTVLQDPAPLLRQLFRNQLGYGETLFTAAQGVVEGAVAYLDPANEFGFWADIRKAGTQLAAGNIGGAVTTVASALTLGPLFSIGIPLLTSGLLEIPATIAQNFANVVKALTDVATVLPIVTGALGAVLAPINAIGDTIGAAFNALGAGNLVDAVVNLINIPAAAVGALLNGYTNSEGTPYPGLLTFSEEPFSAGLVQSLLVTLPKAIAAAIAPETQAATTVGPADTLPGSGTMVTVSEVSLTEAAPVTETAVEQTETESGGATEAGAATAEATPATEAPADAAEVTGDLEGEAPAETPTDLEAIADGDETDDAGTATPDGTDGDTASGNDGGDDTGEAADSGSTADGASGSTGAGESAGGSANTGQSGDDD